MKPKTKTTLLVLTSIGGVIGTGILSTVSAIKTLRKMEMIPEEKIPVKKFLKTGIPYYIPTAVVASGTVVSIVLLDKNHRAYQMALTGAYLTLSNLYSSYRKKTEELYGEEADTRILNDIANDKRKTTSTLLIDTDICFFEPYSETFFRKSRLEVQEAEHELNRLFSLYGYASLLDFLECLDIYVKEPEQYETIGWSDAIGEKEGYSWIDFHHELIVADSADDPDFMEFVRIGYPFEPSADYLA